MDFMDEVGDEIVYMTVDELLTDEHLDHLRDAEDRGVDLHLAGISEAVQERIQDVVPSASMFETLWEWAETPAGSLLITDEETALGSVRVTERGKNSMRRQSGGVGRETVWSWCCARSSRGGSRTSIWGRTPIRRSE